MKNHYNYLNLPKIIQNAQVTDYVYHADGVKVKKFFNDLETDYLDGFQYKSTYPSETDGYIDTSEPTEIKLRIIPNPEGYFDALRNKYYYNFTDHLGNIRLSYSDTNGDGFVTGDILVNNCVDNGVDIVCNSYIKNYDLISGTEKTVRTDMPSDPDNETPRVNNINPILNPNPSFENYRPKPKPFPNFEPISNDKPKPTLDNGLKSIEDMNTRKQRSPLINRTGLEYIQ